MTKRKKESGKYRLKAWSDPKWQRRLSKAVTVSRVDEDIPTDEQKPRRKPWFIALTQRPDLLAEIGGVDGLPDGNTLLLSEDDVVSLVRYLLERQTAMWSDNPTPTEPGTFNAVFFSQPGMVAISESGQVVNGEGQWSPSYFRKQELIEPTAELAKGKLHTLPWPLPAE